MDRTDLKGYFINLAHPEVNMAHIQLTEVVALYPALYYYPLPYSDQTLRPIPHPTPLDLRLDPSRSKALFLPSACLLVTMPHMPRRTYSHTQTDTKKCTIYNPKIEILVF